MPTPTSNLAYIGLDKPTLPYRSNSSPMDDSPHWVAGSQNALATVNGWIEKRMGFSTPTEDTLTSLPGKVVRGLQWQRWVGSTTNSGVFFDMCCVLSATTSAVYKRARGVDPSWVLIYTDTTSTSPFDFITSNNFVFFGNATTRENMRKFDGTDVSLWGLDAPIGAPTTTLISGTLPGGLDFDPATGTISGTPTATGAATITATVTDASGYSGIGVLALTIDPAGAEWLTDAGALPPAQQGKAYDYQLKAQGPGITFALHSGTLPSGLVLSSGGHLSGVPSTASASPSSFALSITGTDGSSSLRAFTLYVGSGALSLSGSYPSATVGSPYSHAVSANGATGSVTWVLASGNVPGLVLSTVSNTAQLAGTPTQAGSFPLTLIATDSATPPNSTAFALTIAVSPASGLAVTTTSLPDAQVGTPYSQTITVVGGLAPYTFSISTGSVSAQTGYVYGYTFTSTYGHESSMSPLSLNTGLFTNFDISVAVAPSPDPQVTGINLYRSTDGGIEDPAEMLLLASLPNATQTYADSTIDIDLGTQTGPELYLNNPPQPLKGFVWSNGRIWGFNAATSWFTGNEEITNGTPVECMSNSADGNYYPWPSQVGGMAVTPNGVDILLSEQVWQISGDTLDTFRKSQILTGGGTLSPTCVAVVGSTVFWIDTARQLFSSADGEIGESIRPDLANIDPAQTFITYHKFSTRNWLSILDAANGKLLLYDLSLSQWQTPWTVSATCLWSGQTASAVIDLLAAFPTGHTRLLTPSTYNDDGTPYPDTLTSNLFTLTPGRSTTARNHTEVRQPMQFEMETSTTLNPTPTPTIPDYFYAIADDDPTASTPTLDDPGAWLFLSPSPLQFGKQSGLYLASRRWECSQLPMCVRTAFSAQWATRELPWKVYTVGLATRTT